MAKSNLRNGRSLVKAYIMTTGALFGLIMVAHVLRAIEEGPCLFGDPWYVAFSALAAVMFAWALGLVLRKPRS